MMTKQPLVDEFVNVEDLMSVARELFIDGKKEDCRKALQKVMHEVKHLSWRMVEGCTKE